jgi:very-short-patch-repair endonuclease/predicted transcriptional regulator of viral defense system
MRTPASRLVHLAERQLGVFTRRQALRCGFSPDAIDGRLACGVWARVHRGVYRLTGVPVSRDALVLAAILAAGSRAYASHETAAVLWQLLDAPIDRVHLTVPEGTRMRRPGVVSHRHRGTVRGDVTRLGPIALTTPSRTIIDLAQTLGPRGLEAALDAAVRRELLIPSRLLSRVRTLATNGRRGMRVLEGLLLDRSGRIVTGSPLEDRFRRLIAKARLPEPVPQFEVRDEDGRFLARVDFAYPAARIAIEIDGFAFHSGRRAWQEDLIRQNALVDAGWLVLRFTKRDITDTADRVVVLIGRALSQRLSLVT